MDIKKLFLDNPHRRHIKVAGGNVEVGLCEVELTPTRMRDGSRRPNKPVRIYDTCGAWGDPDFHFDTSKGLPKIRAQWIASRGDAEVVGTLAPVGKKPVRRQKDSARKGGDAPRTQGCTQRRA